MRSPVIRTRPRRGAGAWILLVAAVGCRSPLLAPPVEPGDRSILIVGEDDDGPTGIGCTVGDPCEESAFNGDDWSLLTVLYPDALESLGIPAGRFAPLPASAEDGLVFPGSSRAFAASILEPDLRPIVLEDSDLYRRYRIPAMPCPKWVSRWSSRAGSSALISTMVAVDPDRVLVFATNGEVLDVRAGSDRPSQLGVGPVVVAATIDDGAPLVLTASGALARLDLDGHFAMLPEVPPLPQDPDARGGRAEIAGSLAGTVVVQLVQATLSVRTATVWIHAGGAWRRPFEGMPGPGTRRQVVEGLVEVSPSAFYSSELGPPLSSFTAQGPPQVVTFLAEIDSLTQLRAIGDNRLLAVSRRNEEVEVNLGELTQGVEARWSAPVLLPSNERWICSSSAMGPILCATPFSVARWVGQDRRCDGALPPIPKDVRRIYPVGDGWLAQSYEDMADLDSLHLIARDP